MRIDDLDTPRVQPGAAARILHTLEAFGLYWDGRVMYQSLRAGAHADALRYLRAQGHVFDCGCTRRQAQSGPSGLEGPIYPGTCRDGIPDGREPRSVRVRVDDDAPVTLVDRVQGAYSQDLATDIGDFVLRRADGIVAYQLATVVDDAAQGVTEVVRGADLLSSTPRQMFLLKLWGQPVPDYMHVPVLVDEQGQKLGKSNGALALDGHERSRELVRALEILGQRPVAGLADAPVEQLIQWAIENWRVGAIPPKCEVTVSANRKAEC